MLAWECGGGVPNTTFPHCLRTSNGDNFLLQAQSIVYTRRVEVLSNPDMGHVPQGQGWFHVSGVQHFVWWRMGGV